MLLLLDYPVGGANRAEHRATIDCSPADLAIEQSL